jgi:uncharacterized lipoprotein YajG
MIEIRLKINFSAMKKSISFVKLLFMATVIVVFAACGKKTQTDQLSIDYEK